MSNWWEAAQPESNWWESAPVEDKTPEGQGSLKMQDLMRSPSTGFAGVTGNKDFLRQMETIPHQPSLDYTGNPITDAAIAGMGGEGGSYADPNATSEDLKKRAAIHAAVLGTGASVGKFGVLGTAKGFGLAEGGRVVGSAAGHGLGRIAENYGGYPKGTANVAGKIGGGLGLVGGPMVGVEGLASLASKYAHGGWRGLAGVLSGKIGRGAAEAGAAKAASPAVASELEALTAEIMSGVGGKPVGRAAAEQLAKSILASKGGAGKIASEVGAARTVARVGAAVPKDTGAPGLAAHRVDVGARRASGTRDPLMTELVRGEAGPVMGEGLGQASPLLPRSISKDILLKMKSLRPEERLAYVARAKDLKTKVQVEAMRRQLEDLGLLVPLAAGAGFASQQDRR